MGLFGNLFTPSTDKEKTTIINDKKIHKEMKVLNDTLNEMTMSIVQESLKNTAAGAEIKQKITISGLKAGGDIDISGTSQKADVEISVSSLTESEMKQELVQTTMNELQAKLEDTMKLSQKDLEESGEQFGSLIAGTLNNLIDTVAGGSTDKETNIEDRLDITDSNEISNSVQNAVNTDLVNSTVETIASNIVGEQETEITDLEAGGSIAITNVEQEILSKQILDSITQVGTGSKIISELTGLTEAEVEGMIEAEEENILKEQGTIDAAGNFVDTAVGAWAGLVQTGALFIIIPVLVVGGIVLFMFRGTISKVAEQQSDVYAQQQTGGSKIIKSLYKNILDVFKNIIKQITKIRKTLDKYINKYLNITNLITLIIICLIVYGIFQIYQYIRYNRMEGFTSESKLQDVMISSGEKYIKNKKLGENQLCLIGDKDNAYKFEIIILEKKDIYLISKIGDKKYYMKNEGGKIKMEKYDFINDSAYKFNFEKIKENTYKLSQKGKYIGKTGDCLTLISEKPKDKKDKKEDKKEDKNGVLELLFE